jgi:hypothetical protein
MTLLAGIVVVAGGLCLIGFTCIIFVRPTPAKRFLMSFASSARAHYVELACRLLLGTSLVALSPAMWQPNMFRVIGWAIVISSLALLLMPWRWHHRFAERVLPTVGRHMTLYGVGVFAFGGILLYGVFFGGSLGAP